MRLKGRPVGPAISEKIQTEDLSPTISLSIIRNTGIETYYDIVLEGYQDELEKIRGSIGTDNYYTPSGSFGKPMLILDTQDSELDVKTLFDLYKNLILVVTKYV